MTAYVAISKVRQAGPWTKRFSIGMGTEKTAGVKHTHMGLGGVAWSFQKLPTDSLGSTTVTFTGVIATSEIRVFIGETEIAGTESASANQALVWPYYAPGNSNNDVTVRIVHPDYRMKEFVYTTLPQITQALPIQQERDRWYSNPA